MAKPRSADAPQDDVPRTMTASKNCDELALVRQKRRQSIRAPHVSSRPETASCVDAANGERGIGVGSNVNDPRGSGSHANKAFFARGARELK